jgi:putative sigma-54 modulation protein
MNIDVKQYHMELQNSVIENIYNHIATDLKRFDHMIRRVCVQITDINGPRGGEDKSCRIQVYLKRASSVIIEDRGASLLAVVCRAVARVDMAMSRSADRLRGRRRSRSEKGISND